MEYVLVASGLVVALLVYLWGAEKGKVAEVSAALVAEKGVSAVHKARAERLTRVAADRGIQIDELEEHAAASRTPAEVKSHIRSVLARKRVP